MPTLSESLADLAEEAPASPTPARIWAEGRRKARARTIATAVVVAATVSALAGVGGFAAHRASEPPVADSPSGAPALPSQIYHPSPWLSGTGSNPPGQLSMLIPGKRGGWPHYHWGMVGVSATTGAYHYLDIPGCSAVDGLAPDGRHVSCFVSVESRGRQVFRGLEIYDALTGHVDRWMPASGGLGVNTVTWNGNDALTFRAGGTSYLWRFGQSAPQPISTYLGLRAGTAGPAGLYQLGHNPDIRIRGGYAPHGAFVYLDPAHGRQPVLVTLRNGPVTSTPAAVSPSGRRIAIEDYTDTSSTLLVGDVAPAGHPTRLTQVDAALQWPRIVGWADDTHLMVVNLVSPANATSIETPDARYALDRVDVETGQVVQVAAMSDEQTSIGAIFATSMLGTPTRDFSAPPTPLNQRLEAGLGLGVLLIGGAALVVWRRRARP